MTLIIKNKKVLFVILLFILAFAPRLFLAVRAVEGPTMDAAGYDARAMSMVKGEGFSSYGKPTSFKPPFYSAFLAFIYLIFGHSYLAARIIQAIMGAFVCVVIFFIGDKIFGEKIGMISGLLAALNVSFIKITQLLYSENLFIFLLCLIVFLFVSPKEKLGLFKKILIGLLAGLAALTRTESAFLLPFIFIINLSCLFLKKAPFINYLKMAGIIFLAYCLTLLPWTIRNWRVHNAFVPFTTAVGINLYSSYCPPEGKKFGFTAHDEIVANSMSFSSDELRWSNFLKEKTIDFIKSNPEKLLRLEILKLAFYWSIFDWEIIGDGKFNVSYAFMLPFFIAGIILLWRSWHKVIFLYLPIIYFQLMALIFYGSPRFRLSVEPFVIIFSSFAIARFFGKFSNKFIPWALISAFACLNFVFFLNSAVLKLAFRNVFCALGLW